MRQTLSYTVRNYTLSPVFLLYERLSNIELGHFDYRLFPFLNPPVEVAIRWPRVLVVKSLFDNQIKYLVWKYFVRALSYQVHNDILLHRGIVKI